MKNLACVSVAEQKEFLNSFDTVLSDVDGVLWYIFERFPGTAEAVKSLQSINKKFHCVTNNNMRSVEDLHKIITKFGVNIPVESVFAPGLAIIDYLKEIKFDKPIYCIGFEAFKKSLVDAGFTLAPSGPDDPDKELPALMQYIADDESIGAVIIDMEVNVNLIKLQKALTYLQRDDVLFITGAEDRIAPVSDKIKLIGPKFFQDGVLEISKRKPYRLGKPSEEYGNFVCKRCNITDKSRVLFVGDTITEDMAFGANCGFKKLLVLTGLTKLEDIQNWSFDENYKPDYYVETLAVLTDIIKKVNC